MPRGRQRKRQLLRLPLRRLFRMPKTEQERPEKPPLKPKRRQSKGREMQLKPQLKRSAKPKRRKKRHKLELVRHTGRLNWQLRPLREQNKKL